MTLNTQENTMSMTLIAFLAVAFSAFLSGCIVTVYLAVWLEDRINAPLVKRQAERDKLAAESKPILTY